MHASKILMGTLLIGMTLTLTACPKSGGGGGGEPAAATPAATPAGVIAANTTPGYVGFKRWQGSISGLNVSALQYSQFINTLNLGSTSQLFELTIQTEPPSGFLPGQVYFAIRPGTYGNNYWYNGGGISTYGSGYMNGNGFIVNYFGNGTYTNTCIPSPTYQCPVPTVPLNNGVPVIQINAQYTNAADPNHQSLTISVTYLGVQVATGTIIENNGYSNGNGSGQWQRWRQPYRRYQYYY